MVVRPAVEVNGIGRVRLLKVGRVCSSSGRKVFCDFYLFRVAAKRQSVFTKTRFCLLLHNRPFPMKRMKLSYVLQIEDVELAEL